VTNNSTRVRIGYLIYTLWRFTAATGYNYSEHLALVATWIPLTELHCADVSLRGLISSDSRGWLTKTNSVYCLPFSTLCWLNGNTGLPSVVYQATQQYRSSGRIHGSVVVA
jgi:hypothetical protein